MLLVGLPMAIFKIHVFREVEACKVTFTFLVVW